MTKHLSKSDFQLASSLPKKASVKTSKYPTANDTSGYMEMLAQGVYVVGKMAALLFPDGIEIEFNTQDCIAQTQNLLLLGNVILFEPAIISRQKLVRVDILMKQGNTLNFTEVKAKSQKTDKKIDKCEMIYLPQKAIPL
jgi:hypothetical protein